jgi:hypothetical protein
MSEQRKAVIKNADMSEEMQQDAVDCASAALSKYNIEKVSLMTFCIFLIMFPFQMERMFIQKGKSFFILRDILTFLLSHSVIFCWLISFQFNYQYKH